MSVFREFSLILRKLQATGVVRVATREDMIWLKQRRNSAIDREDMAKRRGAGE